MTRLLFLLDQINYKDKTLQKNPLWNLYAAVFDIMHVLQFQCSYFQSQNYFYLCFISGCVSKLAIMRKNIITLKL